MPETAFAVYRDRGRVFARAGRLRFVSLAPVWVELPSSALRGGRSRIRAKTIESPPVELLESAADAGRMELVMLDSDISARIRDAVDVFSLTRLGSAASDFARPGEEAAAARILKGRA